MSTHQPRRNLKDKYSSNKVLAISILSLQEYLMFRDEYLSKYSKYFNEYLSIKYEYLTDTLKDTYSLSSTFLLKQIYQTLKYSL